MSIQASPQDIAQLSRLRAMQVRREQQACSAAERECEKTAAAVCSRKMRIAAIDDALDELAGQTVNAFASLLPRWGGHAAAERHRLLGRREREAFALEEEIDEHGQACYSLSLARERLARAQSREDVIADIGRDLRRQRDKDAERAAEAELDDVISAGAATGAA